MARQQSQLDWGPVYLWEVGGGGCMCYPGLPKLLGLCFPICETGTNNPVPVYASPLLASQGCGLWAKSGLGTLGPILPPTGISSNPDPVWGPVLKKGLDTCLLRTPGGRIHCVLRYPHPTRLTMLCEMVRQPYLTPHFLFCHTLRILGPKRIDSDPRLTSNSFVSEDSSGPGCQLQVH